MGISVALSGILLAQYSIELGMLGPMDRISLGLGTGLALHAAAEWFRRQHRQPDVTFAALGIIGAYLAPAMGSTDEGNMLVAMAHSPIIYVSALLLPHYVYRTRLWWGMVAGALLWWLIALFDSNVTVFMGMTLGSLPICCLLCPTLTRL